MYIEIKIIITLRNNENINTGWNINDYNMQHIQAYMHAYIHTLNRLTGVKNSIG